MISGPLGEGPDRTARSGLALFCRLPAGVEIYAKIATGESAEEAEVLITVSGVS